MLTETERQRLLVELFTLLEEHCPQLPDLSEAAMVTIRVHTLFREEDYDGDWLKRVQQVVKVLHQEGKHVC